MPIKSSKLRSLASNPQVGALLALRFREAAETIDKLEDELSFLREDQKRMNYLEVNRVQLNCDMGAPGNYHYRVGGWPSEHSYRAAIDKRIKEYK